MPLVEFISSFVGKQDTVYDIFVEAWFELKEGRNIHNSITTIQECLKNEQIKNKHHRCLEYMIDNNVLYFVYKLGCVEHKHVAIDFLAKIMSFISYDKFMRLQKFFDMLFTSISSDELALALVYCERAVVFGLKPRHLLINYILRFFFNNGISGEHARACIVYMISCKDAYELLRSMHFIETVISKTNEIYTSDCFDECIPLYVSLLQFISYYSKKEIDIYNRINRASNIGSGIQVFNPKYTCHNPATSPILHTLVQKEGLLQPCDVLHLLKFPYIHSINTYIEILQNTGSSSIKAQIIDSIIKNIQNTNEHILFLRYCIEAHPRLIAPYLIGRCNGDWSAIDILQTMHGVNHQSQTIKVPHVCHIRRNKTSILMFLIDNKICDELTFLFIWMISRDTFYSHFGHIRAMFDRHSTFWINLKGLILNQ
ncbi:hypothetical protein CWI42_060700 [Ordospora colligata]|uniref:Uncharacterized protein n=1 Tax=Ordospora colligata OC4 TaxID=1354746 RepID=A0A0B2UEQ8_9MICR|nr:uncharacterized protein M896_060700 [Ordospora colligata OC4]KHN69571.1 hypothetical protein M896_060700 [Ordospora colligata OC4]TBU15391.1 hypothetical protein CWI41_060690 [Ordospora colligata]TBU15491.1 hypothetical protein CWI40_060690 [Ordospora colligata]TBU18587.1 hypothetical protein CWI42_060700 [Ordospora colligata]